MGRATRSQQVMKGRPRAALHKNGLLVPGDGVCGAAKGPRLSQVTARGPSQGRLAACGAQELCRALQKPTL